MSKESQSDKFNIGSRPEDIEKFGIGDAEEELKRARGPVWQSEMPDIRMQVEKGDVELLEEEMQRREDPFFRLNRNFRRLARRLEELYELGHDERQKAVLELREESASGEDRQKIKEEIKRLQERIDGGKEAREKREEEIREVLPFYYDRLMIHNLLDVQQELDLEYLRLRNPVPFETRQQDYYFRDLQRGILTALLEENWSRPERARLWLLKMYRDVLSTASHRDLLKAMAGGLDKFYDWKLVLQQVSERYREDPTPDSYELTFKREFRGEPLPEEIDGNELNDKEAFLMRERSVRYHSDYRYWSMVVASVHQTEYGSKGERITSMKNLSETEKDFIQLLFGTGENGEWYKDDEGWSYGKDDWADYEYVEGKQVDTPHSMLNFPSMKSTQVNKERYIALMSELLRRNMREELKKPEYQGKKKLEDLVKEIKENVSERRKIWYSPGIYGTSLDQIQEEPDVALDLLQADIIVKSGIVYDWGHKAGVHLGWGYNYKYDKKEGVVKRKFGKGETTVATDISTGAWWREFKRVNVGVKGWPTSPLPDMDGEYIKMLGDKPPDYKPTLMDMSRKAAVTQKERKEGRLSNPSIKRLEEAIKKANPALWVYLEDMVWYWETPYTDKGSKKNLVLPIWTPPVFDSINYWNTIAWKPKEKIKDKVELENGRPKITPGELTVWEALQAGEILSEKEWSEVDESQLDDQSYYKHLITMGQIGKLLQIMNEKPENVQQQFEAFFEESSQLDEFRKRVDLGVRDERTPIAVINMSLIPMLIVVATIKKRHKQALSLKGTTSRQLGEWVAGDLEKWRRVIFRSTPEERDGIEGYRDGMVAFFDFYTTQFSLATSHLHKEMVGKEIKTEEYIVKMIKDDARVKVDEITPGLVEESRTRR